MGSDQSVGWLLETLQKVRSVALVGGSVLVTNGHDGRWDRLEVPCYRLHKYNYTYWETYEYKVYMIMNHFYMAQGSRSGNFEKLNGKRKR